VRLDDADDDVAPFLAQRACRGEHRVRLADTGRRAEIDAKPPTPRGGLLRLDFGEQRIGVRAIGFHSGLRATLGSLLHRAAALLYEEPRLPLSERSVPSRAGARFDLMEAERSERFLLRPQLQRHHDANRECRVVAVLMAPFRFVYERA